MAITDVSARLILDIKEAEKEIKRLRSEADKNFKVQLKLEAELSKIKKAKEEINGIEAEIEKLSSRKNALSSFANQFNEVSEKIRKAKIELDNYKKELTELTNKKRISGLDDTELNRWKELTNLVASTKQQISSLKTTIDVNGLKQASTEFNKITNDIEKLSSKKAKLDVVIDGEENVKHELNTLKTLHNQLDSDKADIEVEVLGYQKSKAQLDSISNSIRNLNSTSLQIKGIGSGVSNIGNRLLDPTRSGNNMIGRFAHTIVQGFVYGGMYRVMSSAMNFVEESLSGVANRFDTLHSAEKTLLSMNFSNSTISNSLDDLQNRLIGLPTTMQDAISQVVKISAVNGDLNKSVRVFDALNNGILAFGGSTEHVNRAVTQFAQSIGTGKIDARTFKSLTDNMMSPALAQVAKMFGYTNEEMGLFKQALGDGTISAEQFMDALIELNEKGTDSMEALSKIAHQSANERISTALENVRNRLVISGTKYLDVINELLQSAGYNNIPTSINQFSEKMQENLTGYADYILKNKDEFVPYINMVIDKFKELSNVIKQFSFKDFFEGLMSNGSFKFVYEGIKTLTKLFGNFITMIGGGNFSKGFGKFVSDYLTLAYASKIVGKGISGIGSLFGTYAKLLEFSPKLNNLFSNSKVGKKMGGFISLPKITSKDTKAFDMNALKGSMANVGVRLGNVAVLAGMAGNIMLYAEAIKQLDEKIPNNLESFTTKALALAGTMGGFYLLVQGLSKLTSTGVGFTSMALGLGGMALIGLELIGFAEVMKQIDEKVPDDIGSFASKMANMAIAIGGFTTLVFALGGLASLGGGIGGLIGALGMIFTIGLVKTMEMVADSVSGITNSMNDIANSLDSFDSKKLNKKSIESNLESIQSVLSTLKGTSSNILTALDDLARFKIDEGIYAQVSSNLTNILDIVETIGKIQDTNVSMSDIETTIKTLHDVLETLQTNAPLPYVDMSKQSIEHAQTVLSGVLDMIDELNNLSSIDTSQFSSVKIEGLAQGLSNIMKEVVKIEFPESTETSLTEQNARNILGVVETLSSLLPAFANVTMPENFNVENFKTSIGKIVELLSWMRNTNDFETSTLSSVLTGFNLNSEDITNVINAINGLKGIVDAVSTMPETPSQEVIEQVKQFVKAIGDIATEINDNIFNGQINSLSNAEESYKNAKKSIESLGSIVTELADMTNKFSEAKGLLTSNGYVYTMIDSIQKILTQLYGGELTKSVSNEDLYTNLDKISEVITDLSEINTNLVGISGQGAVDITPIITSIQSAITSIGGMTGVDEASSISAKIQEIIVQLQTMLETLSGYNESYSTIGNEWGIALYNGFNDSNVKNGMLEVISNIMVSLREKDFTSIGKKYGNDLKNGFSNGVSGLSNVLSSVVSQLANYSQNFASAGTLLGNSFASAFNQSISNISAPSIPSVQSGSKGSNIVQKFSNGGKVQYLSSGGRLFKKKGTDTVPAMLTPGEFVIRKEVVDSIGVPFLSKLNGMNFKEAYKSLVGRYSERMINNHYYYYTVNNVTNNNTRSVHIDGRVSERKQIMKAERYMRAIA